MTAHLDMPGQSGKTYRYFFLESLAPSAIKAEPGNYMFVKRLANGNAVPLYIGQAGDLRQRLSTHERWTEAQRLGATQVFAHTTQGGEQVRCAEEKDLIQRWNPPLNTQHRQVG